MVNVHFYIGYLLLERINTVFLAGHTYYFVNDNISEDMLSELCIGRLGLPVSQDELRC